MMIPGHIGAILRARRALNREQKLNRELWWEHPHLLLLLLVTPLLPLLLLLVAPPLQAQQPVSTRHAMWEV